MANYLMELSPSKTLTQMENAIRFEEQSPAHFVKSSIGWHGNAFTNLVEFEELADDAEPGEFKLLPMSAAAPAGFEKYWSGAMIVQGTNEMITAYRK